MTEVAEYQMTVHLFDAIASKAVHLWGLEHELMIKQTKETVNTVGYH